jgi:outer membrane protein OmpA-like peptidoglycan-associated protein
MKTLLTTILLLLSTLAQAAENTDTNSVGRDHRVVDSIMATADSIRANQIDSAPSFCRHEFSIWMAGGISALNYKPNIGERALHAGGSFGLGYTFFFHHKWGVHTGAEIALYNTTYSLPFLKDSDMGRIGFDNLTPGWTGEDEIIDYHVEISSFTEKQRQYSINIPLMLQFNTPFSKSKNRHQFFAMAGAKFGIPIQSTYNTSGTIYTWYHDHKTNQEFRPNPMDYGLPSLESLGCFFNRPYSEKKQNNDFKLSGLASAELGVRWKLNQRLWLYTGAYIDYGFNNIQKTIDNRMFDFDPMKVTMKSNSILTSRYNQNGGESQQFAKTVMPIAFGVKVRLGINTCRPKAVPCYGKDEMLASYRQGFKDGSNERKDSVIKEVQVPVQVIDTVFIEVIKEVEVEKIIHQYIEEYKPENSEADQTVSDILLKAELDRIAREYSNLVDLVILNIDGYAINEHVLTPTQEETIDRKIHLLQHYNSNKYTIIVEGHTCDLGPDDFNMVLGRRRAEEVRRYLIKKGFNGNNLEVESRGENAPIVPNFDEDYRKINRRVVFLIRAK